MESFGGGLNPVAGKVHAATRLEMSLKQTKIKQVTTEIAQQGKRRTHRAMGLDGPMDPGGESQEIHMGVNADETRSGSLTLDLVGEEVDPATRALNPSEKTSICLLVQFVGRDLQRRFRLGQKRRRCVETWRGRRGGKMNG